MAITITRFDGKGVTVHQTPCTTVVDVVDSLMPSLKDEYDTARVVALGPRSADIWAYNTPGPGWDGVVYAIQMEEDNWS